MGSNSRHLPGVEDNQELIPKCLTLSLVPAAAGKFSEKAELLLRTGTVPGCHSSEWH